jgi:hypothetical protein
MFTIQIQEKDKSYQVSTSFTKNLHTINSHLKTTAYFWRWTA